MFAAVKDEAASAVKDEAAPSLPLLLPPPFLLLRGQCYPKLKVGCKALSYGGTFNAQVPVTVGNNWISISIIMI